MKLHAAKLLATVVCCSSVFGVAATPADACLFNCFGGCSPCGYGAGYAPSSCGSCSTGSCGTTAYYAPTYYTASWGGGWGWGNWGWGSSYSSCASCSPCATGCSTCSVGCSPCGTSSCATGSCASGDCGISSGTSGTPTPTPDGAFQKKQKKTYSDEAGATGDELHRTESDSGLKNEARRPAGIDRNALKPPVAVQPKHRQPLLTPPPSDETEQNVSGKEKNTSAPRLPTINLDEKIAVRPAPERKRLPGGKEIGNARLVRVPAYPKGEWLPVDPDSKVASK